jgi:probable rRNA maturation factor
MKVPRDDRPGSPMTGTAGSVHEVDIEVVCASQGMPSNERMCGWVRLALMDLSAPVSVAVRLVGEDEIRDYNRRYRERDRPTNVLSFPVEGLPAALEVRPLGDILVCTPVVVEEARVRGIAEDAHWAHLLIHGTLHLLGFDHEYDADAEVMESREIALLETAGFTNPYH